jgi:hypothetical protein
MVLHILAYHSRGAVLDINRLLLLEHWVVGSNSTQGMNVCVNLFSVCVVPCVGSGLATGLFSVQGVLPTVYKIKKLKKAAKVQNAAET